MFTWLALCLIGSAATKQQQLRICGRNMNMIFYETWCCSQHSNDSTFTPSPLHLLLSPQWRPLLSPFLRPGRGATTWKSNKRSTWARQSGTCETNRERRLTYQSEKNGRAMLTFITTRNSNLITIKRGVWTLGLSIVTDFVEINGHVVHPFKIA